MTLREARKQENRDKIIKAAEFLIMEKNSTDFTMIDLAKKAGVSTFTTHNLIGTKSNVLFRLLIKHIDDFAIIPPPCDPNQFEVIEYFLTFGDNPVDMYLANENFYRPLLGYLMGSRTSAERSEYMRMAWAYWIRAVSYLDKMGLLAAGIQNRDIVRLIYTFFAGAMELWIHGEIYAEGLKGQIRGNLLLVVLACAKLENADYFLKKLEDCREYIDAHSSILLP